MFGAERDRARLGGLGAERVRALFAVPIFIPRFSFFRAKILIQLFSMATTMAINLDKLWCWLLFHGTMGTAIGASCRKSLINCIARSGLR